jgi:hypothetical protein
VALNEDYDLVFETASSPRNLSAFIISATSIDTLKVAFGFVRCPIPATKRETLARFLPQAAKPKTLGRNTPEVSAR